MTIKAQNDGGAEDYFEGLAERMSDRVLAAELRADDAQAWAIALGFWAAIATVVAILEAVT